LKYDRRFNELIKVVGEDGEKRTILNMKFGAHFHKKKIKWDTIK